MLDRTKGTLKNSSLADIARFSRYSLSRARDWYLRNGRFPRLSEFPRLIKRVGFEYQIRRRQRLEQLALPEGFELSEPLDPYQCWIAANPFTHRSVARLQERLRLRPERLPKISVLMPVYNPPQTFFEMAVASVRDQVYENWELCIADDASTLAWVEPRLRELAGSDSRIRVCVREQNGNISKASNSAAALATGDFFLFLDQDDLLTRDALAEVALHLSGHNDVDVLYSDDDKIDGEGRRFAPQFKPDWSPELLLSYMYFSHLFVVRRALFEEVNGFRPAFDGSQDYDLALRVTERARTVAHLPYILYHWRVLPGSTASGGDAKPASFEAGRKAVADALKRRGMEACVLQPEWATQGATGIFWHEFPDEGPRVSVIIPTKNQRAMLERCIQSLDRTTYRNFDVVVVDNGSDDSDTLGYLDSLDCRILEITSPTGDFNFAYINNRAVERVDSPFVLFLNNDAWVRDPKWLSRMVGYARIPGVGAVGARLLYPDGRIQHAGIVHGYYDGMAGPAFRLLPEWHYGYLSYGKVARNCSAVTAACMLTPRQVFLDNSGFDEQVFPVAYNDVDYCYRLLDKGLRCVYAPGAELYHHEGSSRGFGDNPKELSAFRRKFSKRIDRYYNPNLSLTNEHYEIHPRRVARDTVKRPLRTLMCAFNLNIEGAPYSQYEMTLELVRTHVIEPVVFSPTDGPLRSMYERANIEVHVGTYPLEGVFEPEEYDQAIDDVARWIRRGDFQLVYGNTLQTFYAIDAAKRCGLPSLWNIRESEPWQTYFDYLLSPPLARKALSCFALPYRVIFVAHATCSRFRPLNTAHNFCVIHNGIDMRRVEQGRARWPRERSRAALELSDDEVAILLVGTVCPRKGQKDLVQAMSLLDDKAAKQVRLFIVGDRPSLYSSEMKQMVHALPEHRARRISVVPETDEASVYYAAADIFVCTSRIESYPRVILEAMAYRLAVISTPVFGIVEQVRDGVNAEFYEPGNSAELAAKITDLVLDACKRKNYQNNASLVLSSLTSFEEMIDSYVELFRESASI